MTANYHPDSTWISRMGNCIYCSKRAIGILMTKTNDPIGPVCDPCGAAAIKARRR